MLKKDFVGHKDEDVAYYISDKSYIKQHFFSCLRL